MSNTDIFNEKIEKQEYLDALYEAVNPFLMNIKANKFTDILKES